MNADLTKTFPVFELNLFSNANAFVEFWSALYNYPNFDLYKSIVSKPEFTKEDLLSLFEWKNGMTLSSKKEEYFINHVLQQQELIFELKKNLTRISLKTILEKCLLFGEYFCYILYGLLIARFSTNTFTVRICLFKIRKRRLYHFHSPQK
jgi:hypothetical protein